MKALSIILGFLGLVGFCFMMAFGVIGENGNASISAAVAFFCMIIAMMLDPEPVKTRVR